jgi:phospholipase C
MALFITYDEEGGFFDHLVPPTPPPSRAQGRSTVETTNEIFPGDAGHPAGPYGLGVRVPMLVVSPWSRGGWVNSQLFDHTSLIRFLEARFARHNHSDLIETNITPWRRAVVGDLTTAFDFKTPNTRRVVLPGTDAFKPDSLVRHDDEVPVPPAHEALPEQERGVRPARALPYELDAQGAVQPGDGSFWIQFRNLGDAAAVFHVRSGNAAHVPRSYTVDGHKQLNDSWDIGAAGSSEYDLSVYGPNGFHRAFKGGVFGQMRAKLDVRVSYDEDSSDIRLDITNGSSQVAKVSVFNRYSSRNTKLVLEAGESESRTWPLSRNGGWYDLAITVDGDSRFAYRLAGHLENGEDSISDPIMGGLV